MGADTTAFSLLATTRALGYALVLFVVGLAAFRIGILPAVRTRDKDWHHRMLSIVARVGTIASALLVIVWLARLWAQTYSAFGIEEPVTTDLIELVAFDTRWGAGWRMQAGGAVAVAVAFGLVTWRSATWSWTLAGLAAATAGGTLAFTGHAVSDPDWLPWAVTSQVVHVLVAGLWIGTLAAIALIGIPGARRLGSDGPAAVSAMIERFSPLALVGAGALALTGLITAFLYLDTWAALVQTGYGRMLVGKIVIVGVVGAIGAYNWRRVRPRLGTSEGSALLAKSARAELTAALLVVVATAVLVGMNLPHE